MQVNRCAHCQKGTWGRNVGPDRHQRARRSRAPRVQGTVYCASGAKLSGELLLATGIWRSKASVPAIGQQEGQIEVAGGAVGRA